MTIPGFRGWTALVTGASSGIGAATARRLAAGGSRLILVARREDRLSALRTELSERHGADVKVLPADLSAEGAAETVARRAVAEAGPVDLLVNNAGFGINRPFVESSPERMVRMLRVNVEALVLLTHALLPSMVERRRGAVLNVASIGGFQAVPYHGLYSASKALVMSFSESLHAELLEHGIHVTCLAPGSTDTEFFDVNDYDMSARLMRGRRMPADVVARIGLDALRNNRLTVLPGVWNRTGIFLQRFLPKRFVLGMTHRLIRSAPR